MAEIALTIDGLGVDFGGFKAVNGVSLTIEEGELRVLLGANGAGKTTLMDLVSGKTKSTEGRVFLNDTDITNWEEHKIARAGIGRKFQIPSVFKDLTVRRNLDVASCRNPGASASTRRPNRTSTGCSN
jgi:urea transport system ATP-binding protein